MSSLKDLEKRKAYDRKYYREHKEECIQRALKRRQKLKDVVNLRKDQGCHFCGYNKCYASMDMHHVNPDEKKFDISNGLRDTVKVELLVEELDKCIPICRNCHGELHEGLLSL